jgi:hypothetical protein
MLLFPLLLLQLLSTLFHNHFPLAVGVLKNEEGVAVYLEGVGKYLRGLAMLLLPMGVVDEPGCKLS